MVLSHAATDIAGREPNSERRTQILLVDISRAYFNAKTNDNAPIYVDPPPEMQARAELLISCLRPMNE